MMARPETGEGVGSVASIIAEGCAFNGTINVNGGIRIDGQFDGKIVVSETLVVGKSGKVRADVETKQATIAGNMNGEINAKEGVKLQGGSHFEGSIYTKNLVIEEGVYFDGGCWRSRENRPKQMPAATPKPEPSAHSEKPANVAP
ncbi:MAG: polymer-forming cytoskeletal protein [Candidatus Latescibacterota bacterium]|nr:MAG: polymer-forming cytoskeletal protein [Candidatus Latescibacterota bacterium]